jgi:hypothetical protein
MGLTPEVPGTVLQVKPRRGHQQLGQGRHDVRGGRVAGPGEGQELLRQALPVDLFRLPASTAAQMLQLASVPAATTLHVFLQTLGESYQAILSCVPTPKLATCRSGAYVGEPYISKPKTPPKPQTLKPKQVPFLFGLSRVSHWSNVHYSSAMAQLKHGAGADPEFTGPESGATTPRKPLTPQAQRPQSPKPSAGAYKPTPRALNPKGLKALELGCRAF